MSQAIEGSVWKKLLYFFFPLMIGTFFQQLYAIADSMIVGHFLGKQALAAVGGTAASFINLIIGFFSGISAGATVVISHLIGEKNSEKVKDGVSTAVIISIIGGLVFMLLGFVSTKSILKLMLTPQDIFADSVCYMLIYLSGMIPSLVYNIGSGILRAAGDVKRPLYYLIISCISNIILDYLLVAIIPLGIAGAAIATVIAQWISAICIAAALGDKKAIYGIDYRRLYLCPAMLAKTLKIGIPAGMQSIMYNAANMIIQAGINSLGTNTVAAWSIYNKADGIFGMIVISFGTAAMTFTGQNYGAKKFDRIREGTKASLIMCGVATTVASIFFIVLAEPFYKMFTVDSEVICIGKFIMYFLAPFQLIYIFAEILSGIVRGIGKSITPLMITLITVCVLRVIWLFTVVPVWKNVFSVLACFPITWIVSSVAFKIYSRIVMKKIE